MDKTPRKPLPKGSRIVVLSGGRMLVTTPLRPPVLFEQDGSVSPIQPVADGGEVFNEQRTQFEP